MLKVKIKFFLFFALILILVFSLVAKNEGDSGRSDENKTIEVKAKAEQNAADKTKTLQKDETVAVKKDVSTDSNSIKTSKSDIDTKYEVISETELSGLYTVFDNSLFIGDSRTEGMKIYSEIQNADFFCEKSLDIKHILAGETVDINGSEMNISDVLSNKKYSKVYISLGLNELGWDDVNDFMSSYQKLIAQVKKNQSAATVYLELIFPVNESMATTVDKDYLTNDRIHSYNVKITALAKKNKLKYLNPEAAVTDESGSLKSDATNDGIHVNSKYCKQLAGYLAQLTDKI